VACSDIFALGIDKQENLRATMIRVGCGLDAPGALGPEGLGIESPEDFTNINLITGLEIFQKGEFLVRMRPCFRRTRRLGNVTFDSVHALNFMVPLG